MSDVDPGDGRPPLESKPESEPEPESDPVSGSVPGSVPGSPAAAPATTDVLRSPLEELELSPKDWRIVAVAAVEMDLPNANPEVVLHEAQDPWRELRIPVGLAEGTAIAYAFRGMDTPRPLTHEMVTEILDRHDVTVAAVRITVRRGRQFFAEVDTMGPRGRRVVPCRPSDALALALRQRLPTPILVGEWVFSGEEAPPDLAGTDTTSGDGQR